MRSYIPVCHPESAVCLKYPEHRFPGTNFEAAAVQVFLLPAKSEKACIDPSKWILAENPDALHQIDRDSPSRRIDHVLFRHTSGIGAAMSHDVERDEY